MELNYGAVLVTKGKYKGKIGYYDDDQSDTKGIVYFGEPFVSDYVLIKLEYLENITSLPHEIFKKNNKELCEVMGIP
jgi:hypothetical protein